MLFRSHFSTLFGLSLSSKVLVSAASSSTSRTAVSGYAYGQSVPVSCLNRTIDSGEHIKDDLGRLQYIPFPTCNETSLPLALRYGVTETISCTIDSLPDELYHLLEYYVHSDAPLTCRVPTIPLDSILSSSGNGGADSGGKQQQQQQYDVIDISGAGGSDDRPYTPLTIALQGTLQLSHLHIWTDMNVLMHRLSSVESPRKEDEDIRVKKQKQKKHRSSRRENQSPGYVVAGIAYSLPELHAATAAATRAGAPEMKQKAEIMSQKEEDAAMIANARMPWTPGHGSKVVRGEPLTLKFRVSWVSGADSLGWLDHEDQQQHQHGKGGGGAGTVLGFLTKMVFFLMAAGIGALFASYYQRVVRRRGGGGGGGPGSWRGEGILGRSMTGVKGQHRGSFSGVTYGASGRSNGYGGYSPSSSVASTPVNGGGHGYGGYGKKD